MAQGFIAAQGDRSVAGVSSQNIGADDVACNEYTCPGSGTQNITEMGLFCDDNGNTNAVLKLGIYDSAGGVPVNFIGTSAELTAPSSEGWVQDTTMDLDLTGGTDYWLGVFAGSDAIDCNDIDSSSGNLEIDGSAGIYDTWPDPFSHSINLTRTISIYAVYEGASGVTMPIFYYHQAQIAGAM